MQNKENSWIEFGNIEAVHKKQHWDCFFITNKKHDKSVTRKMRILHISANNPKSTWMLWTLFASLVFFSVLFDWERKKKNFNVCINYKKKTEKTLSTEWIEIKTKLSIVHSHKHTQIHIETFSSRFSYYRLFNVYIVFIALPFWCTCNV